MRSSTIRQTLPEWVALAKLVVVDEIAGRMTGLQHCLDHGLVVIVHAPALQPAAGLIHVQQT